MQQQINLLNHKIDELEKQNQILDCTWRYTKNSPLANYNSITLSLTKYFICGIIRLLSASSVRKEVERMEYIISFVLSVMASVVGCYICKWL